jgi:Protein of unknown function (DUF2997)
MAVFAFVSKSLKGANVKTIEITVSVKGETRVESKGFTGNDCQAATRSLELALGARQSESLKSEFYQPARSELEQNAKQ